MNKLGFCVFSYNRPRYLYVGLDSLFRVRGIENHEVCVAVDFSTPEVQEEYNWVLESFPLAHTILHPQNLGCYTNMCVSTHEFFKRGGYSEVIWLDEDYFCEPNLLEYVYTIPRDDFLYNVGRAWHVDTCVKFAAWGVLMSRESFEEISEWLLGKTWIGMSMQPFCDAVCKERESWDTLIHLFVRERGYTCHFSTEADHIGTFGINGLRPPDTAVRDKYEWLFFCREPEHWIFNVAAILYEGAFPKEFDDWLFPRGSTYIERLLESKHPWTVSSEVNVC